MDDLVKTGINNLTVIAKSHSEMMDSQQQLVNWANSKVAESEANLEDVTANYNLAKESGWKTDGWSRQKTIAKKKLIFYQKIQAALVQGYTIVPDFPIDIFAVRTKRDYPVQQYEHANSLWLSDFERQRRRQHGDSLPVGEGEYFDSEPVVLQKTKQLTDGTEKLVRWNSGFKGVDFPLKAVKPVILEHVSKALLAKIFDEVGSNPGRQGWNPGRVVSSGGDPMVIGRVMYKHGNQEKSVSFLIAWWLKASDIEV